MSAPISKHLSLLMAAVLWGAIGTVGHAQSAFDGTGQRYVPTIWVDPDGCEHWVMDDGAEGFMTPHVTPDGKPVCRRAEICGVMPSDQFFSTNQYRLSKAGQDRLRQFFETADARAFIIGGHTDNRASDEYNMRLSQRRANSVAKVGEAAGVRILEARGYGERDPRVPNTSASNMAQNRRVEIICLR
ncbi:OmpA family protein [Phaeobacter sp.]|uniref:OmpA family protein n=1 Tax=Phaeobacter sp. TaxID=1902409 RepID=UPI0025F068BA|nr:OmpA family protein [Phaeobacter sp.]